MRTPKVFFAAVRNHARGIDTKRDPDVAGLNVGRKLLRLIAAKECDIEPIFVELVDLGKKLPGPGDCLFL